MNPLWNIDLGVAMEVDDVPNEVPEAGDEVTPHRTTDWRQRKRFVADTDEDFLFKAAGEAVGTTVPLQHAATKVVKRMKVDPEVAPKILNFLGRLEKGIDDEATVPPIKALADLLDCGQTMEDYEKEVRKVNVGGKKQLPSYKTLQREKLKMEPHRDDIWLTDSDVGVGMQALLDVTVKRLLLDDKIVARIGKLRERYGEIMVDLIFKLGVDGSTKHPVFKQVSPELQEEGVADEAPATEEEREQRVPGACLLSSMVPLQLIARLPDESSVILHQNHLCNSSVSGKKKLVYTHIVFLLT